MTDTAVPPGLTFEGAAHRLRMIGNDLDRIASSGLLSPEACGVLQDVYVLVTTLAAGIDPAGASDDARVIEAIMSRLE
jgi:hypothetical protein